MDIDDILADVSRSSAPSATQDLHELTRFWVAERVAPELLVYPEELMERVLERIRKQVGYPSDGNGPIEIAAGDLLTRGSD
jgi:GINS complex subunit 4